MHWHRTESFRSLLEQHQFRDVVLTRHPLDVLISILHFAPHEPDTARWLEGEAGAESSIWHVSPCQPAFLAYATSRRATTLLNVSREWWQAPGSQWLRYEDLVNDQVRTLEQLGHGVGAVAPTDAIAKAIAANSIEVLRPKAHNQHFWRGRPGHWKTLLPATESRHIVQMHRRVFDEFGYTCDPDKRLGRAQADENWLLFRVGCGNSQQLESGNSQQITQTPQPLQAKR